MFIRIKNPDEWYKVDSSCVIRKGDWKRICQFILERDGFTCQYCRSEKGPFEVDHVLPKSRGGTDDYSNLLCACMSCNRSKKDRTPEEWIESMR